MEAFLIFLRVLDVLVVLGSSVPFDALKNPPAEQTETKDQSDQPRRAEGQSK